jgi:hypothetical protein
MDAKPKPKRKTAEELKRSLAMLSKLESSEQQLYEKWLLSQKPEDAGIWLQCVHQARQVAREASK